MKRLNYLAIPLAVLLTACQSIGGVDNPLSQDSTTGAAEARTGDMIGDVDMDSAAQELGVSPDDLKDALGTPPLDVAAAAEKLGVSESALREALDSAMPL